MNKRWFYWFVPTLVFPILISACSRNFGPAAPPNVPTATPVSSGTPTGTPTLTATSTPTETATASPTSTGPCSPLTTTLAFTGNLNSAQAADAPGGVLNLGTSSAMVLPLAINLPPNSPFVLNESKLTMAAYGSGNAIFQVADLTVPLDPMGPALANHTTAAVYGAEGIENAWYYKGSYAWEQNPALPPGAIVTKAFTDVAGNPRQVTFLFYQVNDIGTASPPVNPNPPHQAAWAWYAFDTTGGAVPGTANLIEGTGIIQGSYVWIHFPGSGCFYNRGVSGDMYWGDLIYFNADGSLASEGATRSDNGIGVQAKPEIVLPPVAGWLNTTQTQSVTRIGLNFGTAGMSGYGQRDGLTGDAAASSVR